MLEIEFKYPPLWSGEYYDPENMMAYIFGKLSSEECMRNINHANLHFIIQTLEGKRTSFKFDKVARRVLKQDRELYAVLY